MGKFTAVNAAYDAYRAAVEEAQAYDDVYFTLEYNKGRDDALAVVLDGTIDLRAVAARFARDDSQGGGREADRALTQRWNKAVQDRRQGYPSAAPPCPMCGGWDCDVSDEGICQSSITEDEIRRDCNAQRPDLTETFVSLWRQGRILARRDVDGKIRWATVPN